MNEDAPIVKKDITPTWVENKHGVKSCWPRQQAEQMVKKNFGWSFCTPEDVPANKQYPLGRGELTEEGRKRRIAAQESQNEALSRAKEKVEKEDSQLSHSDLKTKAKRLGIDKYWIKSKERLLKEIIENEL